MKLRWANWEGARSAARRSADPAIGVRGVGVSGALRGLIVEAVLLVALSCGLFWLVWIYAIGLRDPRYLDGWVMAGAMILQLGFHIAIKTGALSPKSVARWRKLHIFNGYLLIAAFISHSNFSLPETGLEWALWTGFALISMSGVFGVYLAWSLCARHGVEARFDADRIAARRAELALEAHNLVSSAKSPGSAIALPASPHDAWIEDLHASYLQSFLAGQRNFSAHLIGSQRPLKRLTDEIDSLSRYVDKQSKEKLAAIKDMVVEKDRLDFACAHLGLAKSWQLVHVPVTYALVVLTVLHVIVVYAFSAESW